MLIMRVLVKEVISFQIISIPLNLCIFLMFFTALQSKFVLLCESTHVGVGIVHPR